MKISYRRSGGFAPMPVSCTIDTDTCPSDEGQELKRLIQSSGIMQASTRTNPAARDVRLHTVTVEQDGTAKEVSFDDITIPEEARPLFQFLQSRAKSVFGDDD